MQDPLVLEVDLFFNFFFIARTVDIEDMTVNWLGGGSNMQQRDPGRESNPGSLQ